jgi:hypothetical protein
MLSRYSWEAVVISLITFFVYFFTISPLTAFYAPFLLVFCLVSIVFLCLFLLTSLDTIPQRSLFYRLLLFSSITAALFTVGLTGWFTSPFFYLIYCLAFALAFLFNALTSFTFVLTIVALLLLRPNLLYNLTSVIALCSLFLVVPLAYLITHLHLQVKQKEKSILILQDNSEEEIDETKAQKALHNKVIRFASTIREDLSDIKQLTFLVSKSKTAEDLAKRQREIMYSVEDALLKVKDFEAETTGSRLLDNP